MALRVLSVYLKKAQIFGHSRIVFAAVLFVLEEIKR